MKTSANMTRLQPANSSSGSAATSSLADLTSELKTPLLTAGSRLPMIRNLLASLVLCRVYALRHHSSRCSPRYSSSLSDVSRYPSVSLEELLKGVENHPDNSPPRPAQLKNKYYGLRHGESEANLAGVISSDPYIGATKHGLTSNGILQARNAAKCVIEKIGRDNLQNTVFLSSNFKRARETAIECIDALCQNFYLELIPYKDAQTEDLTEDLAQRLQQSKRLLDYFVGVTPFVREELRERFFGELDGSVLINYNRVWPVDLLDAFNHRQKVESVHDVIMRAARLVESLEMEYEGKHIIFASHADTLQIFQTYLNRSDPRKFSMYRFKNGEVSCDMILFCLKKL